MADDTAVMEGDPIVDPPSRVVFTWGWDAPDNPTPPDSATVEITVVPDGDGTSGRIRSQV